MARLAVLASGSGSNYEAIVEALREARDAGQGRPRHDRPLLLYDRKAAFVAERSRRLGLESSHVTYLGRSREEAEAEIDAELRAARIDLVALAGFMRLLSPSFVEAWRGRLVNLHPSLLPAWPGSKAIERSYASGDKIFGISVHFVDPGMDTGALIAQDKFEMMEGESLAEVEARIHELEHRLYPRIIIGLLDEIEAARRGG